jgi:N-acetylmuramoyl-L-alanine amidase
MFISVMQNLQILFAPKLLNAGFLCLKKNLAKYKFVFLLAFILISSQTAQASKILTTSVKDKTVSVSYTGDKIKTRYFVLDGKKTGTQRYVVDFVDAELTDNNIAANAAEDVNVKISQFSTKPLVTRLVIEAPKAQVANFKIVSNADGKIVIGSGGQVIKTESKLSKKKENKTISINEVSWNDKQLLVSGNNKLSYKTTNSAQKQIIELSPASFKSSDLASLISAQRSQTSEEIRVVQYEPTIVRISIKGPEASLWKADLSTDEQKLTLAKSGSEKTISEKTTENNNSQNNEAKKTDNKDLSSKKNEQIEIEGSSPTTIKVHALKGADIHYKVFRLNSPERLILDLYDWDNQDLAAILPQIKQSNLLIGVRVGKPNIQGKVARFVFDLSQKNIRFEDKIDSARQNLSIVLSEKENSKDSLKALRNIRIGLKVVVDAGHGGYDAGAIYSGTEEKDVTLSMTKYLQDSLSEAKVEVTQTRKDDQFISLEDRVNITRNAKPDVFVSIHCNALESSTDVKGIETYYFTPQSRALANILHKKVVKATKSPDRSVRKARFVVIRETAIPSVLIETGFLSNPQERGKLIDKDYQNKIAKAVAEGIIEYANGPRKAHSATAATH